MKSRSVKIVWMSGGVFTNIHFFCACEAQRLYKSVFSICVGILLNASTSPDENDGIDVELQCDMLFIVSSLCEGDTHRKVRSLRK